MADRGWKRHERDVSKFFGTTRALHGLDRGMGEVHTDVFVDITQWYAEQGYHSNHKGGFDLELLSKPDKKKHYTLVVECKYASGGSSSHDWPIRKVAEIEEELKSYSKACKWGRPRPMLITRDQWAVTLLSDFHFPWRDFIAPDADGAANIRLYENRHVNKTMSKFMVSAYEQALTAAPPPEYDPELTRHVVCLGSNQRLPKVICWPLIKDDK